MKSLSPISNISKQNLNKLGTVIVLNFDSEYSFSSFIVEGVKSIINRISMYTL